MKKLFIFFMFLFLCSPCLADEYYLGQWEWCTDDTGSHWCAPQSDFLTGTVDLRSLPQMGKPGGTSEGWAIFSYSQPVVSSNLSILSNSLDKKIKNPTINKIEIELGISIQTNTVREVIWEILTLHGDPTGQTKWKPLIPDTKLKRKLHIGTEGKIKEQSFKMFETKGWELVLETEREDYRNQIKEYPQYLVAQHLDYLEEKYKVWYGHFIPDDEIFIASLPHNTTITSTFDCANSDSLSCDGISSWTEVDGDWDIISNTVYGPYNSSGGSFPSSVRADTDLSSTDHYSQVYCVDISESTGAFCGVANRFSSSAETFYTIMIRNNSSTGHRLTKVVAGTETVLKSDTVAKDATFTVKLETNGSNLIVYQDAAEYSDFNITDTSITTGLRTGMTAHSNTSDGGIFDDFEAADLASDTRNRIMIIQ